MEPVWGRQPKHDSINNYTIILKRKSQIMQVSVKPHKYKRICTVFEGNQMLHKASVALCNPS